MYNIAVLCIEFLNDQWVVCIGLKAELDIYCLLDMSLLQHADSIDCKQLALLSISNLQYTQ